MNQVKPSLGDGTHIVAICDVCSCYGPETVYGKKNDIARYKWSLVRNPMVNGGQSFIYCPECSGVKK